MARVPSLFRKASRRSEMLQEREELFAKNERHFWGGFVDFSFAMGERPVLFSLGTES